MRTNIQTQALPGSNTQAEHPCGARVRAGAVKKRPATAAKHYAGTVKRRPASSGAMSHYAGTVKRRPAFSGAMS